MFLLSWQTNFDASLVPDGPHGRARVAAPSPRPPPPYPCLVDTSPTHSGLNQYLLQLAVSLILFIVRKRHDDAMRHAKLKCKYNI